MFKKMNFFGITVFFSTLISATATDGLQNQLQHIKTEMLSIKRTWNSTRIHIKMTEKTAPRLYQTLKNTFDTIITSQAATTKINDIVTEQVDAIVNKNMSFASVKKEL